MLRIKLFGLFITYAVVALVRPREMRKMLDAADGFEAAVWHEALRAAIHHNGPPDREAAREKLLRRAGLRSAQECPLPPAGWRCTRRAGHDGPCAAAVVK